MSNKNNSGGGGDGGGQKGLPAVTFDQMVAALKTIQGDLMKLQGTSTDLASAEANASSLRVKISTFNALVIRQSNAILGHPEVVAEIGSTRQLIDTLEREIGLARGTVINRYQKAVELENARDTKERELANREKAVADREKKANEFDEALKIREAAATKLEGELELKKAALEQKEQAINASLQDLTDLDVEQQALKRGLDRLEEVLVIRERAFDLDNSVQIELAYQRNFQADMLRFMAEIQSRIAAGNISADLLGDDVPEELISFRDAVANQAGNEGFNQGWNQGFEQCLIYCRGDLETILGRYGALSQLTPLLDSIEPRTAVIKLMASASEAVEAMKTQVAADAVANSPDAEKLGKLLLEVRLMFKALIDVAPLPETDPEQNIERRIRRLFFLAYKVAPDLASITSQIQEKIGQARLSKYLITEPKVSAKSLDGVFDQHGVLLSNLHEIVPKDAKYPNNFVVDTMIGVLSSLESLVREYTYVPAVEPLAPLPEIVPTLASPVIPSVDLDVRLPEKIELHRPHVGVRR